MQGFNMGRYVPPELEGLKSFNQASGKKASNRKADGTLVVRFECPFPIWCTHCDPETIIGQGVRFNAEKRKVGNYFSTPIWSFQIKHTVCGGLIDIHTDPKNTEYVVVNGGRKRDTGSGGRGDWIDNDGSIELGAGVKPAADLDVLAKEGAFGQLEKSSTDKEVANKQKERVDELRKRSQRDWADPYEMNKKIRRDFRVGRRQRQHDQKTGEALQERFGLGLDIAAPAIEDTQRASLIDFKQWQRKSAFATGIFSTKVSAHPESLIEPKAVSTEAAMRSILVGNTRARSDPFLQDQQDRKQELHYTSKTQGVGSAPAQETGGRATSLVDYDSD